MDAQLDAIVLIKRLPDWFAPLVPAKIKGLNRA
jgi:hypothetical protein